MMNTNVEKPTADLATGKKKKRTLMEMAQALKTKRPPQVQTQPSPKATETKEEEKAPGASVRKKKARKPYSRTPVQIPEKYTIEYKRLGLLRHFLTKYGKIRPRRVSRIPLKQQRQVAKAIRRARATGLIPCDMQAKNS